MKEIKCQDCAGNPCRTHFTLHFSMLQPILYDAQPPHNEVDMTKSIYSYLIFLFQASQKSVKHIRPADGSLLASSSALVVGENS